MQMIYTLIVVGMAAIALLSGNFVMNQLSIQLHPNSFINGLFKYQIYAVVVALLTLIIFRWYHPESVQMLRIGDLFNIAGKEKILGINGKSSWLSNGLQLLFFISLATGVFMFFGVREANRLDAFEWWFFPYVLLFSLTNSFAEEIIFRYGVIAGLENTYSVFTIQLVSAVLFGLPHYFGSPGGSIGILMSGVLGYILCKATLETKGISIAWGIHFVQDIIIFTGLMMMRTHASAG